MSQTELLPASETAVHTGLSTNNNERGRGYGLSIIFWLEQPVALAHASNLVAALAWSNT